MILLADNVGRGHLVVLADLVYRITRPFYTRPPHQSAGPVLQALPVRKRNQPFNVSTEVIKVSDGEPFINRSEGDKNLSLVAPHSSESCRSSSDNSANCQKPTRNILARIRKPAPIILLSTPLLASSVSHRLFSFCEQFSASFPYINIIPPAPYFILTICLDLAIAALSYSAQGKGSPGRLNVSI